MYILFEDKGVEVIQDGGGRKGIAIGRAQEQDQKQSKKKGIRLLLVIQL